MAFSEILNKIKIDGEESYRLNTAHDFYFSETLIKKLSDNFDPQIEKGGLIYFTWTLQDGNLRFSAKDVDYVTNLSETPNCEYSPDKEELKIKYKAAFAEQLLPLAFHTHPTKSSKADDIVSEGMNYLYQLNTSIEDKGYTLRNSLTYDKCKLRLPDVLVVVNSNAVFVGLYGGLVAPMCFTQQKEKASQDAIKAAFNSLEKWANTPERQAALIFSAFALVILGVRYYKVSIPTLIAASIIVPPLTYASQEKADFFGVSYGTKLHIHIPKIPDQEIIQYEINAKEALKAAIERAKKKALKS